MPCGLRQMCYCVQIPAADAYGMRVTVQPYAIPRVKSLSMRFCELCKRQNATLEHFVCIRRDSEAEG